MAMGTRRKWVGTLVILAVLLWISAVPGHTDRGGHGYRGHGHRGHGYRVGRDRARYVIAYRPAFSNVALRGHLDRQRRPLGRIR
jgi:hypothetical protein